MKGTSSAATRTPLVRRAKANNDGNFDARLDRDRFDHIPHLVVRVRLDLGNGPEWIAVGRLSNGHSR